jgi:hypothetical protein
MPDFYITLHYNPGIDTNYLVEDKPDQLAARQHLADNIIGYDPGVEVSITETPINTNPTYRYMNLGRFND